MNEFTIGSISFLLIIATVITLELMVESIHGNIHLMKPTSFLLSPSPSLPLFRPSRMGKVHRLGEYRGLYEERANGGRLDGLHPKVCGLLHSH